MCINISPLSDEEMEKNIVEWNGKLTNYKELQFKMCGLTNPKTILKQIFKKNYVEFPGMEKASEFVLKNFRKTVNDTLRR